jgi:hypothetical protein
MVPQSSEVSFACSLLSTLAQFARPPCTGKRCCNAQLIFDDADIFLSVGSIYVDGRLRIGDQKCRLKSTITIQLSVVPGIYVQDKAIQISTLGQLDIWGTLYYPTWTRLAATTYAGATTVQVQVCEGEINAACCCIACKRILSLGFCRTQCIGRLDS